MIFTVHKWEQMILPYAQFLSFLKKIFDNFDKIEPDLMKFKEMRD